MVTLESGACEVEAGGEVGGIGDAKQLHNSPIILGKNGFKIDVDECSIGVVGLNWMVWGGSLGGASLRAP